MTFARPNDPPPEPREEDASVQALIEEIDNEVKVENLKKFFKRYGNAIAIALVAVLLGTAGFSAWGGYITSMREKETAALIALMDRSPASFTDEELKSVLEALVTLGKEGHGEGIRFGASISEISILVKKNQKEAALQRMEQMSSTGRFSPMYRDYIRLQSIRMRVDSGDPQKLLAELEPLIQQDSSWYFSAVQMAAMLEAKSGNPKQAVNRLEGIIKTPDVPLVAKEEASQLLRLYKAM